MHYAVRLSAYTSEHSPLMILDPCQLASLRRYYPCKPSPHHPVPARLCRQPHFQMLALENHLKHFHPSFAFLSGTLLAPMVSVLDEKPAIYVYPATSPC